MTVLQVALQIELGLAAAHAVMRVSHGLSEPDASGNGAERGSDT